MTTEPQTQCERNAETHCHTAGCHQSNAAPPPGANASPCNGNAMPQTHCNAPEWHTPDTNRQNLPMGKKCPPPYERGRLGGRGRRRPCIPRPQSAKRHPCVPTAPLPPRNAPRHCIAPAPHAAAGTPLDAAAQSGTTKRVPAALHAAERHQPISRRGTSCTCQATPHCQRHRALPDANATQQVPAKFSRRIFCLTRQ